MTVNDDIKELSVQIKKLLSRRARQLLEELPGIHTIIIDRREGVAKARDLSDFELLIFVNENSEDCNSDNCTIFDPGKGYVRTERPVLPDETIALQYRFTNLSEKRDSDYLNLLQEHLKVFKKNRFPDIITVNSQEMEKDDPLYYKLFISYRFKKGYLLYNRFMQSLLLRWDAADHPTEA